MSTHLRLYSYLGILLRIVSKWSIEIEPTDRICAVRRSTSQIIESGLKTISNLPTKPDVTSAPRAYYLSTRASIDIKIQCHSIITMAYSLLSILVVATTILIIFHTSTKRPTLTLILASIVRVVQYHYLWMKAIQNVRRGWAEYGQKVVLHHALYSMPKIKVDAIWSQNSFIFVCVGSRWQLR